MTGVQSRNGGVVHDEAPGCTAQTVLPACEPLISRRTSNGTCVDIVYQYVRYDTTCEKCLKIRT